MQVVSIISDQGRVGQATKRRPTWGGFRGRRRAAACCCLELDVQPTFGPKLLRVANARLAASYAAVGLQQQDNWGAWCRARDLRA